ncbi:hypothetical protein YC2023_060825 [Brassica napus]
MLPRHHIGEAFRDTCQNTKLLSILFPAGSRNPLGFYYFFKLSPKFSIHVRNPHGIRFSLSVFVLRLDLHDEIPQQLKATHRLIQGSISVHNLNIFPHLLREIGRLFVLCYEQQPISIVSRSIPPL